MLSRDPKGHCAQCRVADVLRDVGELEILQAPGLPSIIPREYADLPHLTGGKPFC